MIFFLLFWSLQCLGNDGEVLLSYLLNSRMTIVLKGSYASDSPLNFNEINGNKLFVDHPDDDFGGTIEHQMNGCNPYSSQTCLPAYDKLPLYIDIGGIRLSPQNTNLDAVTSPDDSENFWDIVSNSRQVYCNQFYATSSDADSCFQNDGLNKFKDFMNGKGAIYSSNDVSDQDYIHVGVFVRRIVTGWAYQNSVLKENVLFDNARLRGENITGFVSVPPNVPDGRRNVPEWFPLHYRVKNNQSVLRKGSDYLPIVLEIRFNMKENLMAHSITTVQTGRQDVKRSVITFSDWRVNHEDTGNNTSSRLGGNVLMRARLFYPHRVSRLVINNTGTVAAGHYYALYENAETDRANSLPYAATPARSGTNNQLNHIMPGSYQLLCYHANDDNGYPEPLVGSAMMSITIPDQGQVINETMSCP